MAGYREEKEIRRLTCSLSKKELEQYSNDLAVNVIEYESLEEEKKDLAKSYSEKLSGMKRDRARFFFVFNRR